jgi:prevent-host-death family protein
MVPTQDICMDLFSVRQARDNLYKLVDEVAEHHKPVVITGRRNHAVLISKDDWDAIVESLYLNSIPQMVDSIQQAAQEPIEECTDLEDLDW